MNNRNENISENERFLDAFKDNARRFSHHAMATIYEIIIPDEDADYAEYASRAAFDEIDRLENELSRFRENSEIAKINSLSQFEDAIVSLDAYECLKWAEQFYQMTRGAFDISAGPLIDLWKNGEREKPDEQEIRLAMNQIGLPWLQFRDEEHRIVLNNRSVRLDLGGIGKGYAVDRVCEIFDEWNIKSAMIHGGRSTVYAYGNKKNKWPISILGARTGLGTSIKVNLREKALSASGMIRGQHIIDPRNGYPVAKNLAAWALAPKAVVSDALSTAFMIMPDEEIKSLCNENADTGGLVMDADKKLKYFGDFPNSK